MTDPEIEHQRLTSGNAAAIASATEQLDGPLLDVDRAQEDLAGYTVRTLGARRGRQRRTS